MIAKLRGVLDSVGDGWAVVDVGQQEPPAEFGFRPFPSRGGVVTNELIDRIREDIGV